jgi:hypothetical protein
LNYTAFAKATVFGTFTASQTTLTLNTNHGARLPAPPFRFVLRNASDYQDAADAFWAGQAEICECTAKSGDTLTAIERGLEGTIGFVGVTGKTYKLEVTPLVSYVETVNTRHLNPKSPEFGAKGDGSTDDTAAIQACIDKIPATGGKIIFPPGTYKITASLKYIPSTFAASSGGLVIEGSGVDCTVIKGNSLTSAVLKSKDTTNRYWRIAFRDITISNTSRYVSGGIGVELSKVMDCNFHNVRINEVETGIYAKDESWYNLLDGCFIQGCITGVKLDNGSSTPANEWTFNGGKILDTINGMILEGVTNTKVFGTSFETFVNALHIGPTANTSNTTVYSSRMENGTAGSSVGVSAVADNGSGIFRVTTASAHGYSTGNRVAVVGATGTGSSTLNQGYVATVIDSTHLDLQGATYSGPPTVTSAVLWPGSGPAIPIVSVADNGGGLFRVTTPYPHGLYTNNQVKVTGSTGTGSSNLNNTRTITVISSTTFDLVGSTYSGPPATTAAQIWGAGIQIFSGSTYPMIMQPHMVFAGSTQKILGVFPSASNVFMQGLRKEAVGSSSSTGTITLDVANVSWIIGNAGSATTVTDFVNGYTFQVIGFIPTTANYTLQHNASSGIFTNTAANKTLAANQTTFFVNHSGLWRELKL